jgi:hypothetical protein
MLYQDRLIEDNLVFTTAISPFETESQGSATIWFFTKVDKFPNVSLDDLNSRIPALLKAAVLKINVVFVHGKSQLLDVNVIRSSTRKLCSGKCS